MLNINITKKKFNKLLISTNRLIESFFNNLSSNIKEYKKKSSIYKKINNRAFLVFGSLLFLSLTYFLIPSFFDKNSVKLKLEQIIKDQYNIQIKFVDDISYSLFPKPHFYANNLNIFQDDNILINSKNTKINISINKLFSFNELKVKNILFKDNEFNIKKKNLTFFSNILNSNKSLHNIIFQDSIIFYKDKTDDVIFLIDLDNLKFFFDIDKNHQLTTNFKIFNLPFKLYLNHNIEENFFTFNLDSKNIRMKLENFTRYRNEDLNGNLEAQILNNIKQFIYNIKNNSLLIKSEDEIFQGKIDLKPFYLSLNFHLNEFDIKNFLKPNSIFINLINSEILNNQNINADINVNLKKIKNFKYVEKIKIKTILEEGNIFFKDISTNWNDSVLIQINDTQLLNVDNKVNLIGSIDFDFTNLDKFYRYYQINEKYRDQIKKIKFDFFLNLNEKRIQINNAKIDNILHKEMNSFLENLNLEQKNLFNKVVFRNFVKSFFEYYQEG